MSGEIALQLFQGIIVILILGIPLFLYVYGVFREKKVLGIFLGAFVIILHIFSSIIPFLNVQLVPFILILSFILISNFGKNNSRTPHFDKNNSRAPHPYGLDYESAKWNLETIHVVVGIIMGIGMQFVGVSISYIFKVLLENFRVSAPQQDIMKELFNKQGVEFYYFIFMIVIMAPIVEEFVIRLWLYDKVLKKIVSVKWAMIISALVFSLLHFNLLSFPVIVLIGIINCILYDRKGYWWPVFFHMGFNGVSSFIIILMKYLYDVGIIKDLDKLMQ